MNNIINCRFISEVASNNHSNNSSVELQISYQEFTCQLDSFIDNTSEFKIVARQLSSLEAILSFAIDEAKGSVNSEKKYSIS